MFKGVHKLIVRVDGEQTRNTEVVPINHFCLYRRGNDNEETQPWNGIVFDTYLGSAYTCRDTESEFSQQQQHEATLNIEWKDIVYNTSTDHIPM